jgi:hypothetical protein
MTFLDIWAVLENPAWIFFGLTVAIGLLGFALLLLVYPFGEEN